MKVWTKLLRRQTPYGRPLPAHLARGGSKRFTSSTAAQPPALSTRPSAKAHYAQKRERAAKSKIELASLEQIDYLRALIAKTDPDRLDAEFADAIAGTAIAPRAENEGTDQAIQRLTGAAARKLISSLADDT
ncbi:hypothetical protein [Nocardia farcinica]|uniref:hypothetical protein n=1 Tax=Nocardia farcinica TaxID=37329 RepID=UPI001E43513C|nr:hypothetical protein [Nocardia farcinica]MCZ9326593.1 hypothetical protein [Nocardia farcinica]